MASSEKSEIEKGENASVGMNLRSVSGSKEPSASASGSDKKSGTGRQKKAGDSASAAPAAAASAAGSSRADSEANRSTPTTTTQSALEGKDGVQPPPSSFTTTTTTTNAPLRLGSESKGSYDLIEHGRQHSGHSEREEGESESDGGAEGEDEEATFQGRGSHSAGYSLRKTGSGKPRGNFGGSVPMSQEGGMMASFFWLLC